MAWSPGRLSYGILLDVGLPVYGAVEEPGEGQADGDVEYVGADARAHRHVTLTLLKRGGGGERLK